MGTSKKLAPVHPGEVLLEEFLNPLEISQNRLALDIGVDSRPVSYTHLTLPTNREV